MCKSLLAVTSDFHVKKIYIVAEQNYTSVTSHVMSDHLNIYEIPFKNNTYYCNLKYFITIVIKWG